MSAHNTIQIHLLTNAQVFPDDNYISFIDVCAKSGITHLQLRQKNWAYSDLLSFGRELKAILSSYDVRLIINDDFKLMLELDADGIHLGQSDSNPKLVRQEVGKDKIIGLSIESMNELLLANQLDCLDYVAASSVFPTDTKKNLNTIWGIDGLPLFCQQSRHPVIAIGGINLTNVGQVYSAGITGIALISAIHEAANPSLYIQNLINQIKFL